MFLEKTWCREKVYLFIKWGGASCLSLIISERKLGLNQYYVYVYTDASNDTADQVGATLIIPVFGVM